MSIAKKALTVLAMLLMSASCGSVKKPSDDSYSVPLLVGKQKIFVEIADTNEKKARGLSDREKLKDDEGMLFDFRNDYPYGGTPGFWMKEMKFDLDLIWLRDEKVAGLTANVPHPASSNDKLPIYYPPSPIDMVLEVNAGWSEKHDVKVGEEIKFGN